MSIKKGIFLFSILLFFSLFFCKPASASITWTEFSALSADVDSVSGLIRAFGPIDYTYSGIVYTLTDYLVIPCTTNCQYVDFSLALYYSGNPYVYGDGGTFYIVTPSTTQKSFFVQHNTSGSYQTPSLMSGNSCVLGNCKIVNDIQPKYTSRNIRFMNNCTNFQTANVYSPLTYIKCADGTSCSPIAYAITGCSSVVPVASIGTSCSSSFANVPSLIDDPTGWITSIWSALGDWFKCLFSSFYNMLASLINSAKDFLASSFSSAISKISLGSDEDTTPTQEVSDALQTFYDLMRNHFTDIFVLIESWNDANTEEYDSGFSGTLHFQGGDIPFSLNPFANIPPIVPTVTSIVAFLSLAFFLVMEIPTLF